MNKYSNVTTTETQHSIQFRTRSGEHQPIVTSKWLTININYHEYKYYIDKILSVLKMNPFLKIFIPTLNIS